MLGQAIYSRVSISGHETAMLQACNVSLAFIEPKFSGDVLHVDISKSGACSQLNGLFGNDGFHGMLKVRKKQRTDMVCCFITFYVDIGKMMQELRLAVIYTIYFRLVGDQLSALRIYIE